MLDNKNLSEFVKGALQDLSYNERVNIYDKNCPQCPFNSLKVVKNNKVLWKGHNLYDAIETCLDYEHSNILRLCAYGEEEYTTQEIASNTCRMWRTTEHNESIFIEVYNSEDLIIDVQETLNKLNRALVDEELKNL